VTHSMRDDDSSNPPKLVQMVPPSPVDSPPPSVDMEVGFGALSRLWQEGFPGVEECMMIAAVDRAGAQMVLPMPYEIKGRKLRWLEDPLDGSTKEAADLVAGGRLSDALVALMTRGSN